MAPSMSTTVLIAALAALLVVSMGVSSVKAARPWLAEVEWPCCRQYDEPQTVTSAAEVAAVPEHHEELAVIGAAGETSEGAATVEGGAEPEWPCCRQYENPAASAPEVAVAANDALDVSLTAPTEGPPPEAGGDLAQPAICWRPFPRPRDPFPPGSGCA